MADEVDKCLKPGHDAGLGSMLVKQDGGYWHTGVEEFAGDDFVHYR